MAFVYQHRRLDTNQVFYIGISKTKKRFKSKLNRNIHWLRIAKKHGFEVDILIEGCNWQEACEIEIGLIASLGRQDLNLGNLVNMTNGGDGCDGVIMSKEAKRKISIATTGSKNVMRNPEVAKKVSNKLKLINVISVQQFSIQGLFIAEFYSVREAYNKTGVSTSSISKCCKSKLKTAGKYIWKYKK